MIEEQKVTTRIVRFEVLRILAMFMVLLLHFVSQSRSLAIPGLTMTSTRLMGGLVESFCIVAVDVYVLISGYFLCEAPYKLERVVRLECQILFYTILIPVILRALGLSVYGQDPWTAAVYFLPVSMNHYWFATAYVLLYLFTPLLNMAVRHLTRRQLKACILCLLFFFSFLPSISPVQLLIDQAGYDFGWFLVLYLIAAYLRRYGSFLSQHRPVEAGRRRVHFGCCYILCSLLIYVLYAGLHRINERTGQLQYYSTVPFHYNSILCLLGAIGLFELFALGNKTTGSVSGGRVGAHRSSAGISTHAQKAVLRISPLTFGIYLIHQHVDIRDRWYPWMASVAGEASQDAPLAFLVRAFLGALLLFIICAVIDGLRQRLFRLLTPLARKTFLARWCRKADAIFSEESRDT